MEANPRMPGCLEAYLKLRRGITIEDEFGIQVIMLPSGHYRNLAKPDSFVYILYVETNAAILWKSN